MPFADNADAEVGSVDALGLGDQPTASRIEWIASLPKVPLDVAASGPRVIGLAAVIADRITFAVGADVERLAWAIEVARTARRDAGLDPDGLALGAYVNVAVHPDRAVARQLVAGGLSTLARFNVMHGTPVGPYDDRSAAMLTELHQRAIRRLKLKQWLLLLLRTLAVAAMPLAMARPVSKGHAGAHSVPVGCRTAPIVAPTPPRAASPRRGRSRRASRSSLPP